MLRLPQACVLLQCVRNVRGHNTSFSNSTGISLTPYQARKAERAAALFAKTAVNKKEKLSQPKLSPHRTPTPELNTKDGNTVNVCKRCQSEFKSRAELFSHLRDSKTNKRICVQATDKKGLRLTLVNLIQEGSTLKLRQLMRKCVWYGEEFNTSHIAEDALTAIMKLRSATTTDYEILAQL